MKKNRSLALLILLAMLLSACARNVPADQTQTSQSNTVTETETEMETEISDDLPDTKLDGYEFRMFIREGVYGDSLFAEEMTGSVLNDIVYDRNLAVEERFDVSIVVADYSGDNYGNDCIPTIKAGDDVYDLIAPQGRMALNIALQGLGLEWSNLPYVNLDKPWWDSDAKNSFTLFGHLYAMTGDIDYNSIGEMFCLVFNKNMMDEEGMEYPYQDVLNGTWTWDKWEALSKQADRDLNGDGNMKDSDDQLGYATSVWDGPISMQFSAGLRSVTVTDGIPSLTFMSERTIDVYNRYFAMLTNKVNINANAWGSFIQGRVLFMDTLVRFAIDLRDMEDDFGIIPFPKYEETDSAYSAGMGASVSLFLVPVTVSNPENTSIVLEAMAAESHRNMLPDYYDVVLKTKHVRDPESSEILDLIRRSRMIDFGYFCMSIGLENIPVDLYNRDQSAENLVSYYQSKESAALRGIENLKIEYQKISDSQKAE